jgi:hypothetical protein
LSAGLCLFLRGPSRIQPPEVIAGALRFIGRHTLEIYAIQLDGSINELFFRVPEIRGHQLLIYPDRNWVTWVALRNTSRSCDGDLAQED